MSEATRDLLPRVKVCGLTTAEDVALALDAGADACGFVHHPPSPRSVPLEELARLASAVRGEARSVLVLVDADPAEVSQLVRGCGIDLVQLCGDERPEDWRDSGLALLRRLPAEPGAGSELERWRGIATGFVIDHPSSPGGSGRGVDVELAASFCREAPCLLAGGLGADNVAERIARVRPAGVDAASRLEASPGRKNTQLTRDYVRHALRALRELPA